MKDAHDIGLMLDSNVALVIVETNEEQRVLELLTQAAMKKAQPLYVWSATEGLRPLGYTTATGTDKVLEPNEVLQLIRKEPQGGVYVLCDFHPYLSDAKTVRFMKDIALNYAHVAHTLVLISHELSPPPELRHYCARVEMTLPSEQEILSIIREEAKDWSERHAQAPVRTDNVTLQKIVENLKGLNHNDVRRVTQQLIANDGAITADDLTGMGKKKFALMNMNSILSIEHNGGNMDNIAGMHNLKEWLLQRKLAFFTDTTGLDKPRGILLLGVQGAGKSLAAKAVAGLWGVPLLRLDFGALYNKYIGESEKNLRDAIRQADIMSPCVLWIDEIEKGIAADSHDNGTSQRILGTLLTWLEERESEVFIVATSNNIAQLPPELIRKGRLDEIFFVDLPSREVRSDIFRIHLTKRQQDPATFDLQALADITDGFSGAEIEQAVVAGLYRAAAQKQALDTTALQQEVRNTAPMSVVMAEQVQALRQWAGGRTVSAD